MIKLNKGDTVAVVSLSSGTLGEPSSEHQLTLGKQRLEDLGLKVKFMDNALKGIDYFRTWWTSFPHSLDESYTLMDDSKCHIYFLLTKRGAHYNLSFPRICPIGV